MQCTQPKGCSILLQGCSAQQSPKALMLASKTKVVPQATKVNICRQQWVAKQPVETKGQAKRTLAVTGSEACRGIGRL
jgi:hypothetical protein